MRLIDADKLKEHIHKIVAEQKGRNIDLVPVGELPILIDKQPTAYDVDKVVEQLEENSFEIGKDSIPVHYVRLNKAIEIVKGGGADASGI